MQYLVVIFLVACAVVPGAVMLFAPQKAFTTAYKPRWPGAILLAAGLLVLYTFRHIFAQFLNGRL